MIQESYVTFEQAKELKELGFPQEGNDYPTHIFCDNDFMSLKEFYAIGRDYNIWFNAPTLSLVQKWLMEEKNIYLSIMPFDWVEKIPQQYQMSIYISGVCDQLDRDTYEEALSAGIDKCIEILKEK